ncbi:MAG: aminotransferase class III-fold pyridoxal phosphate-dependent enzyme, partial [Clostridiales bacterium]|nr:aminotransferase class III-fold pyridoxal phosphate-dependent enzyme [Clostridiales bacterium]
PHKYEIVTALGSFHGRTYGSLSATGQPQSALHKGFAPLLPGFKYAKFNDLAAFEQAVDENTVAIMLEPVQGEGGVHPATQEFMRGIRALCDEKGLLLLLDEIQTGWGRCGSLMAYMGYDVKPDAVTMAKAMGNGLPIGALCSTEKLAQAFTAGAHGTTFGGNALACAGALAAVKEIVNGGLAAKAAETGAYFKEKLAALLHIKEIRGLGLLVGLELDAPKAAAVKSACLDRKFLLTSLGDSVLRMVPPLTIDENDVGMAVEILKAAIEEVYAAG